MIVAVYVGGRVSRAHAIEWSVRRIEPGPDIFVEGTDHTGHAVITAHLDRSECEALIAQLQHAIGRSPTG